jgi:putative membrane protein
MMDGAWGSGWMGGGWMGFGGGLLMLLFWVLAAVGLVALMRWLASPGDAGDPGTGPSALELLRRRYASGEIDQATYREMKQELDDRA